MPLAVNWLARWKTKQKEALDQSFWRKGYEKVFNCSAINS